MANRLIITHTVEESLLHIIHPVADQALHHVINELGYKDLFKDNIDVSTDFRDWSKTLDENSRASARGNRVRAKLNPNVNPSTIKWEGSGTTRDLGNGNMVIQNPGSRAAKRLPWERGNFIPDRKYSIFNDVACDTDLTCDSVGSSLSMEIRMEFGDEFLANEAISRIYQCFHNGDMINYVDIMYDYPIPSDFQAILAYIYSLRGKRSETDTMYQWLQDGSDKGITILQNRNRPEYQELVINKNHFQALYLIECNQETPEVLQPKGAAVTFTLTLQYARANRIRLEYPIIINNQYVEPDYIPAERKTRACGLDTMIMWDNPAVSQYWYESLKPFLPPKPVMFPFWDPWDIPDDSKPWLNGYYPVLIAAFTLDDIDNPKGVTKFDIITDMAEILGSVLNPTIVECIRRYRNKTFGTNYFVNISVFADDISVGTEFLDISDGHTLTIKCRDTNPIYRLVFGINPKLGNNQVVYQRTTDRVIETNQTYYTYENGVMRKIKATPWYSIENIEAKVGRVYTSYANTNYVYDVCKDTIAQEDSLYFVIIDGEYVVVQTTPGESMADIIAKYGTIYTKRDVLNGNVNTISTDTTAKAGVVYRVRIGDTYLELVTKKGDSLDAYRKQYATYAETSDTAVRTGVVYCIKSGDSYIELETYVGESIDDVKFRYSTKTKTEDKTAVEGKSYCVLVDGQYIKLTLEPGASLDDIRKQYAKHETCTETETVAGKTYCFLKDGQYIVITVEPGTSIDDLAIQYGEHTVCTDTETVAGKTYGILVDGKYVVISPEPGTSIEDLKVQYGKHDLCEEKTTRAGIRYVVLIDGKWTELEIDPGQDLDEVRAVYGDVYILTPCDIYTIVKTTIYTETLADIFTFVLPAIYEQTLADIYTLTELVSFTDPKYAWNRVYVASIRVVRKENNGKEYNGIRD